VVGLEYKNLSAELVGVVPCTGNHSNVYTTSHSQLGCGGGIECWNPRDRHLAGVEPKRTSETLAK